jgi:WD40 repeat protein/serine/threonine protein kinase
MATRNEPTIVTTACNMAAPEGSRRGASPPHDEGLGTFIGPYKLLSEIGGGGMGTVYLAEQAHPVQRKVALKVIKPGMASGLVAARFEAEGQALALMDHPNIAKVLDAGTTETGLPYFVMELVKGAPITTFCDEQRLTLEQRLELFVPVCQAVQHAHQKGIIHRDLKPSNVLIALYDGRPVPKVIDFGIAKATGPRPAARALHTECGTVVGTLEYMSPEQAEPNQFDIDTRSDVYSLGVLLYELLTGTTPLEGKRLAQGPVLEALRLIREDEPLKPSTRLSKADRPAAGVGPNGFRGLVRGELDWVVMKCLEKDRNRRYETANALAQDVRRYLADEPVQACPPSAWYRFRKFARRNRAALTVAALAVVMLLLTVVGLTISNVLISRETAEKEEALRVATRNEEAANEQRKRAERVAEAHRKQLVRALVAHGVQLLDGGDALGSLPWFAQALVRDQDDPARAAMHRARLAAVMQSSPRLVHAWFHDGMVAHAEFSHDGRYVASASHDGPARVWNVATGAPVTRRLRHVLGGMKHVAFSPNDDLLVTSGQHGEVVVWEVTSGKSLARWRHGRFASYAAFSPDGRRVVTCGDTAEGGEARVWDVATGKPVGPALKHPWDVVHASFSLDGRRLVTACAKFAPPGTHEGEARVWDAATGTPITPAFARKGGVPGAWFSPDGRRVLTAASIGNARVWDAATGELVHVLHGSAPAGVAAFSADGSRIVTAGQYGRARVYDAAKGVPTSPEIQHTSGVLSVALSPDGRLFLAACADGTVWLRDTSRGAPVTAPLRHGGCVKHAAFSPDGKSVVTSSNDRCVRVWGLARRLPLLFAQRAPGFGTGQRGAFSPDGRRVLMAGEDQPPQVWDLTNGKGIALWPRASLAHVVFSPDGRHVLTCGYDGTARVWDAASGEAVSPPLEHGKRVMHGSFSPEGNRVVTGCADGRARVWNVATGKVIGPPLAHVQEAGVSRALFSSDGRQILTAGGDCTVCVWSASTGKRTVTLRFAVGVTEAALSADGSRMITACVDGSGQVWRTDNGKPVGRALRHDAPIERASFSGDGARVVTASVDATARVWDAVTGEPVTPPLRHRARVRSAELSPDGRRVVTASRDGTARVWDAATGEPLTPPLSQGAWLTEASFSPDGRRLLTVQENRTVHVWELPRDDRPVADLVLLANLLSARRLDGRGDLVPLAPEELRATWRALRSRP